MNLSARDLRAVLALIEERSFTRAAERCRLSQSAFSTLIRGIEDGLGARLFERSTRTVEVTPEGRMFEASARRVLGDFEHMVSDFRDHALGRKGRVAIAALPSLAAGWLPGVLSEFRRLHPGIELALFDTLSDRCVAQVRAAQVDLAVASVDPAERDLETELLCSDEFHLVCRRDHPLARLRSVRVKDLAGHAFVHLARTSSVRRHLEAAIHPARMNAVLEVEHLATVTGMVEAGVGVSVVPALTLFHFERPRIVVRPLRIPGLVRRIHLIRHRHRPLSIAARAMYDLLVRRKPGSAR